MTEKPLRLALGRLKAEKLAPTSQEMNRDTPAIGIIGGSGLYQMEGVENATEQRVETP